MGDQHRFSGCIGVCGAFSVARLDHTEVMTGWANARADRWEASVRAAERRERARQIAAQRSTRRSYNCGCNLQDELGMPTCLLGN